MDKQIYKNIQTAIKNQQRLLAILLDPDKLSIADVSEVTNKINASIATHIFVGGSTVDDNRTEALLIELRKHTDLPLLVFPGDTNQISNEADGLLFLSLISGRNPDYLIGKQVEAVSKLRESNLEVIPTGYILIGEENETAVENVSQTKPIHSEDITTIADTAKAGEYLGFKLIYLEAGSGANHSVTFEAIQQVKSDLNIPLIVGGGIMSKEAFETAHQAGANMVVIGTAFENDLEFLDYLETKYQVEL
ncbi:geranylgeranylglyceryl/heptaprenylglyceryl phosphate synthase [Winogradskyella maritima]|uniref:Geranylgeranylglyceryl phosphate synthase n=1 Tax=Winogradskyella maritima TaxID=1517766 RepID=A0ABV8AFQ1_9FLAO